MATEFDGRWTRIERNTFERLVVAAENHQARQGRDVSDVPEQTIFDWLNDLENARILPTPSAEPGDLLVKLARGEFWSFTSSGWIELAPVYRMGDERAEQTEEPFDPRTIGEHGAAHNVTRQVPTDEPHSVAYEMRFGGPHREVHAAIDEYLRQRADAELEGGVVLALADWLSHRVDLKGRGDA